jgi:lysophospholipase L1-like esterase
MSNSSKEDLLIALNEGLSVVQAQIKAATHIIITLGTSWVYKHLETDQIVANCHKLPQQQFEKKVLAQDAIQQSLQSIVQLIKSVNKDAQIIFTVSPVRHIKDGFVENTVSKSRLISAVYSLLESHNTSDTLHYFPSFELMNDELRDYRFYAEDLLHPSSLAITYIWEKFKTVWIDQKAFGLMEKVDAIQKRRSHHPFNEASEKHQQFLEKLNSDILAIQKQYPHISF